MPHRTTVLQRLTARLAPPPDRLLWDGAALVGEARSRTVEVLVPARLLAAHAERFPAAAETLLREAARLRAQRAFAAIAPVACEALIGAPGPGGCRVLLLALPAAVVEAIRAAAAARRLRLAAVRPAELCAPVPAGGLSLAGGAPCLVALADGVPVALAPLPADRSGEERERLRLGLAADAPAAPAPGPGLDFLHPLLSAREPLLARRGVRLGLLAGAAALALALGAALWLSGLAGERDAARAELARLAPLAGTLRGYRDEQRALAPWFEGRADPLRALAVVAEAMPAGALRLTRLRQGGDRSALAEGVAGDRALLFDFLARLRRDPRVQSAELRSFRALSKGGDELGFELVLRLAEGAGHA